MHVLAMTIRDVETLFATLQPGETARFDTMREVVLAWQRMHNPVYARYGFDYLPVEAFKRVPVTTFPPEEAEAVFESSGTGHGTTSRHYVRSLEVYERAFAPHFEAVLGPGPFTFVAHLPHYAARGRRSSLLYMAERLVARYGDDHSGFFLDDHAVLHRAIRHSQVAATPFLLLGAAFGLLDLVEQGAIPLPPGARVIETGGMKTYRREVRRDELHQRLATGFGITPAQVWSEYGMCELMSQCYTRGGAVFFPPPWMRFAVLDPDDPTREPPAGQPGVLALFDLANLHTCSGLLTEDRAVRRGEGFEVLGRLSQAELRGCNFLLEPGIG
jgi:hypothetical protein